MPFAGMSFLALGLVAEPTEVIVIAPTNVVIRVIYGDPLVIPEPPTPEHPIVLPPGPSTNEPPYGQIPPFTVMTNMCEVPITEFASGSTNAPGGTLIVKTENKIYRRRY